MFLYFWPQLYSVSNKKVPLYFYNNFSSFGPISIIRSLLHLEMNCGRNYHLAQTCRRTNLRNLNIYKVTAK